MSSSYSTWFRKGVDPGTIIALDHPRPSQWKILEKLNEYNSQVHKGEHDASGCRSFASAKLLCCSFDRVLPLDETTVDAIGSDMMKLWKV
ncbi:uncharacterized protein N7458_003063 [Penicillium daleae]|uniref:Uncharacterized protein n=1 Tax=Penicillium daleae TaxID=63821 RepID=A0AAD6G6U6_9EURO|nr:uncharacterized protein N7458_003063 [Penicillium daleae]KAJ5461511.1 hypothetical protein N7458_003063 [Penicillium daleae]